jgi:hypothetical protein
MQQDNDGPVPPERKKISAPSGLDIVLAWKLDGKDGAWPEAAPAANSIAAKVSRSMVPP